MDNDAVRQAILDRLNKRLAESQAHLTSVSERVQQGAKQRNWEAAVVPMMLDMVQALFHHQLVLGELTAVLFDPNSIMVTYEPDKPQ